MTSRVEILERIRQRGLVFDGAMGSLLEARRHELPPFGCGEELVLEKGSVIEDIHRRYFEAGADVVETCTFGATPHKLGLNGLEGKVREINYLAALFARRAAMGFPGALVAGSMGPTGLLSIEKRTDFSDFYLNFRVQAESLLLAGVDILLLETCNDILETRAGILACRDAMKETGREAVLAVSFTVEPSGRLLMGTPLEVAAVTVDHLGVDLIGVNCSMGPDTLLETARGLSLVVGTPLLAMPNCGLPENIGGHAVYTMPAEDFARSTAGFRPLGFACLGGCCGTTPECIRALRACLAGSEVKPTAAGRRLAALTGAFEMLPLQDVPKPLIVGERLNYHGSRKFRAAADNMDIDAMVGIASSQLEKGAKVLDVCLATREPTRHQELIRNVYPALAVNVPGPIMADTTETEALEEACKRMHGRGVLNSCNLEDEERCRGAMRLAARYGQMLVCLPLGTEGIPEQPEKRLETARRIVDIAVEEGLAASDLLMDPLTLTIGTGRTEDRTNALIALETLRLFKERIPEARTVMGVSNVSYGLPVPLRSVINNVLLHHAGRAGLDFAIFNPLELHGREDFPEELWNAAEDLLLNRAEDALDRLLGLQSAGSDVQASQETQSSPDDTAMQVKKRIISRRRDGWLDVLDRAVAERSPQELLNVVFLQAMQEVGQAMEEKGLPLPYVLASASMVQEGLQHLKKHFTLSEKGERGKIVLATVKGDVHDIGKNLVRMLLVHNGYEVIDLGADVPSERIVDTAIGENADAVGLSALLVSTSREMKTVVDLLDRRRSELPVVLGGAAVSAAYAAEIARLEDDRMYPGGVFHAADAFQGLKIFGRLADPAERKDLVDSACQESVKRGRRQEARIRGISEESLEEALRTEHAHLSFLVRTVRSFRMDVDALVEEFDIEHHCGKKFLKTGAMDEEFYRSLLRTGRQLLQRVRTEHLAAPQGVVGTFPLSQRDGRIVLVNGREEWPLSLSTSCARRFLRRDDAPVLPMLAVTLGSQLNGEVRRCFDEGDYLNGYILSTIGAELAEILAEITTRAMLEELGAERNTVVRYSPGYPIWPDLADQKTIFSLLDIESRIGAKLTEAFQIVPEFSVTAGLVRKVS